MSQTWTPVGQSINADSGNRFGCSVSLSDDGTIIAIGILGQGVVEVYKYINSSWEQIGNNIYDTTGEDFGVSVSLSGDSSLSSDGTVNATVAIGAFSGGDNKQGLVKVYKYLNNDWEQIGNFTDASGTSNEGFGNSVSLNVDGSILAIGAPGANNSQGFVQVYQYISEANWNQLGKNIVDTSEYTAANEFAGFSVALSSDGKTVAIGAPFAYIGSGIYDNPGYVQVYTYDENTNNWNQLGENIVDNDNTEINQELSGWYVALSSNGRTVAIGSPSAYIGDDGQGKVQVYTYDENTNSWKLFGNSITNIPMTGSSNYGYSGEQTGFSVALSSDGTMVAIGSPYYSTTTANQNGLVQVYKYSNEDWTLMGEFAGTDSLEQLGYSVSLNSDGTVVAFGSVGGGSNNSGLVQVYQMTSFDVQASLNNGLKLVSLNSNLEQIHLPIENVKKGDFVKTTDFGYRKVNAMINGEPDLCHFPRKIKKRQGFIYRRLQLVKDIKLIDNIRKNHCK